MNTNTENIDLSNEEGILYIIPGKPGEGKTERALIMTAEFILKGHPVVYYTEEGTVTEVLERISKKLYEINIKRNSEEVVTEMMILQDLAALLDEGKLDIIKRTLHTNPLLDSEILETGSFVVIDGISSFTKEKLTEVIKELSEIVGKFSLNVALTIDVPAYGGNQSGEGNYLFPYKNVRIITK